MKSIAVTLLACLQLASCRSSVESDPLAIDSPTSKKFNINLPATTDVQSLQAKLAMVFATHRNATQQGRKIADSVGNKIECGISKSVPAQYSCLISAATLPGLPDGLAERLAGLLPEGRFPNMTELLGSNGKINCIATPGRLEGGEGGPDIARTSTAQCFLTLYKNTSTVD